MADLEGSAPSVAEIEHLDIHPRMHYYPEMRIEAARGTKVIGYPDAGFVTATGNETRRIATGGLTGCNAVGVAYEIDHLQVGYVQHYPPHQASDGVEALRDFLESSALGSISCAQAAIMVPGERERPWGFAVFELRRVANEILGSENVEVVIYDRTEDKRSRALLVELLAADGIAINADGRGFSPISGY